MSINQKGFVNILLITVLVAIVAISGYFVISKNSSASNKPLAQQPVAPNSPSKKTISQIKTGTSFGMCGGYCYREFTISSTKIAYNARGWGDESYPEIKKEISFSSDEWQSLIDTIDTKEFNLLPERIGCPDCADGGAEWIEITDGKAVKKVEFDFGDSISGNESFLKKLREIRNNALSQIDKQ
ncbi:hypothetical protein EB118_05955 [bacterium]|nr:hypothetical protein [bacterium]NBX97694.1 hypothetical protein [bacterium]NDC94516.1 hypothetical protein [bacterium]NDD83164.1 hypothetical protein [bacterium]NDG29623.1 hypothetical protein [bacterium]